MKTQSQQIAEIATLCQEQHAENILVTDKGQPPCQCLGCCLKRQILEIIGEPSRNTEADLLTSLQFLAKCCVELRASEPDPELILRVEIYLANIQDAYKP